MKIVAEYDNVFPEVNRAVEALRGTFIKFRPFSHELVLDDLKLTHVGKEDKPFSEPGKSFFPYGSTDFLRKAKELGWAGVVFDEEAFTYSKAEQNRNDMLNSGGLLTVEDAILTLEAQIECNGPLWKTFLRPDKDLKAFAGGLMSVEMAYHLLSSALCRDRSSNVCSMDRKDLVVLSTPKEIKSEWRVLVVGGRVVSASRYRFNGQLNYECCDAIPPFRHTMQDLANKWLPAPTCAMDVCLTNGEYKIVEFNCINCAGFYAADPFKVLTEVLDWLDVTEEF